MLSFVCSTNLGRGSPWIEGKGRNLFRNSYWQFQQLLDRCLGIVDPDLYAHLRSKNLSAEIYAFPCGLSNTDSMPGIHTVIAVLTLCACTPPLDEVLRLWDFLLAFGVHLNVLCVIAQLLLIRDDVMTSSRHVILRCCGTRVHVFQPNAFTTHISSPWSITCHWNCCHSCSWPTLGVVWWTCATPLRDQRLLDNPRILQVLYYLFVVILIFLAFTVNSHNLWLRTHALGGD